MILFIIAKNVILLAMKEQNLNVMNVHTIIISLRIENVHIVAVLIMVIVIHVLLLIMASIMKIVLVNLDIH